MPKRLVIDRYLIESDEDYEKFSKNRGNLDYLLDTQMVQLTATSYQQLKKLQAEYERESAKAEKEVQEYLKENP